MQTESPQENSSVKLSSNIWKIYQDKKGNHWFGSNDAGLFRYDGKTLRQFTEEDGLLENSIRGIQEDHLGNIFVQTVRGVCQLEGQTFKSLKPISAESNEWKLESTDLFFNCPGTSRDVYRYDGEQLFELALPRVKEIKDIPWNRVYEVFRASKDGDGNIWFGTASAGVYRYDGNSFLHITEKELLALDDGRVPGVRGVVQDQNGDYWFGNILNKYAIDAKGNYKKKDGIPSNLHRDEIRLPYFTSMLYDEQSKAIWMTSYSQGVWSYDGETFKNHPIEYDGPSPKVFTIYQDNSGKLWLGSENAGVFKWEGNRFVGVTFRSK